MRAVLSGVLAWIVGASVAVGVGMLALSRIGYGFTVESVQSLGSGPAGEPSAAPSASASAEPSPDLPEPSPTPSPSSAHRPGPSPVARERALSSPGGTAIVRCTGSTAYLVSWSPEPGYHVDDVRRGPDQDVAVKFDGREQQVVLRASCPGAFAQGRVSLLGGGDD